MKQLQLRHISPYLPYDLQCANRHVGGFGLTKPLIYKLTVNNIMSFIEGSTYAKVLLRPLNTLTDKMPNSNVSYISYLWFNIVDTDYFEKSEFFEDCQLGRIDFLPIFVYEQLLMWHFDVNDLISQGFAYNINDVLDEKNS